MARLDAFRTDEGHPVPAVTATEMQEVDRLAMYVHGPNLFQMMENAGRNLALTAIRMLGDGWRSAQVLVLAGTGGNGGGGIAAARHLANRGVDVSVAITDEAGLGEVPASQLATFRATPGRTADPGDLDGMSPELIIDAVIGYSLRGAPRGTALDFIEYANRSRAPLVSLDVPSGIDATTGSQPGSAIVPTATLTLALPKTGLAAPVAGDVVLADIGIPIAVYRDIGLDGGLDVFGQRFCVPLLRV